METELIFATREDFQEWLKNYGQISEGVWLLFGKTKTLKHYLQKRRWKKHCVSVGSMG